MAIRGIYNADGTTTYTVADTKKINDKCISGKVIYGQNDLVVAAQSTPNMTIKVSSGWCSIAGAILENTASFNITIPSNTASYPRVDAIVAYISGTTYSLRVLQGTPSSTPSAPSTSSSTYVKLAEVFVGVGVTSIQQINITDSRATNNQNIITSLLDKINEIDNKLGKDYQHLETGFDVSGAGTIFQWGVVEVFFSNQTNKQITVTLPKPNLTETFSVVASEKDNNITSFGLFNVGCSDYTASSFKMNVQDLSKANRTGRVRVAWQAVGK